MLNETLEKILLNIKGINLVFDKGPRDELINIAEKIFPEERLDSIKLYDNCYSGSSWSDNLDLLFNQLPTLEDGKRFELIRNIKDPIKRMHQTLSLLNDICNEGKVELALHVIQSLANIDCKPRVNDTRALGYRKLLEFYAKEGDFDNFKKYIQLCEPGKERYAISRIKYIFISSYTLLNGADRATNIARKKPFGKQYLVTVLSAATELHNYQEMEKALNQFEDIDSISEEDQIRLLAESFKKHVKTHYDEKHFDELFHKIDSLNPKIRSGDFKLRDILLMTIGMDIDDLNRVTQCRKAINNRGLKSELKFVEETLKKQLRK